MGTPSERVVESVEQESVVAMRARYTTHPCTQRPNQFFQGMAHLWLTGTEVVSKPKRTDKQCCGSGMFMLNAKEKNFGQFSKNYRTYTQKFCHQALKIWGWDPGSGKTYPRIPDPGPGVKRYRIPNPDPQHCT